MSNQLKNIIYDFSNMSIAHYFGASVFSVVINYSQNLFWSIV